MILGTKTYNGDADTLNARVYKQSAKYVDGKKIPVGTTFCLAYR